jgi:hypothetical protein
MVQRRGRLYRHLLLVGLNYDDDLGRSEGQPKSAAWNHS